MPPPTPPGARSPPRPGADVRRDKRRCSRRSPPFPARPARAPHSRPRGGARGGSGSQTPRARRAPAARGQAAPPPALRPPARGRSHSPDTGRPRSPTWLRSAPLESQRLCACERRRPAAPGGVPAAWPLPEPRRPGISSPPCPPRPLASLPGSLRAPARARPAGPGAGTLGEARPGSVWGGGGRCALGRRGAGVVGGGRGQALLHKPAFPVRRRFRGRLAGGVQVRAPGAGSLSSGHAGVAHPGKLRGAPGVLLRAQAWEARWERPGKTLPCSARVRWLHPEATDRP